MTSTPSQAVAIIEAARVAEDALRQLNHATLERPIVPPADISTVLAHLAGVAAALPQSASQLAEMLENTGRDPNLTMDSPSAGDDPVMAIDTARLHLDAIREPAVDLYRHLDGAHQQIAHIATAPPPAAGEHHAVGKPSTRRPLGSRPEHRDPHPTPPDNHRPIR